MRRLRTFLRSIRNKFASVASSTLTARDNNRRVFQRLGGGGGLTIPSPGRSPKQPLPGIGLHDPLHGRQACPEFSSFHQGFDQISPLEGLFSYRPLPKRGQICDIRAPPIVERLQWPITVSRKHRDFLTQFSFSRPLMFPITTYGIPHTCK